VTTDRLLAALTAAVVCLAGAPSAPAASTSSTTTSAAARSARPKAATKGGSAANVLDRVAFLTLVFDGKQLTLYVDGTPAATHAERGAVDAGATDTEIGAYASRSFWNGTIDEVAMYNTALSPATVASQYRVGSLAGASYPAVVKSTPGLVGYWRLDRTHSVRDSAGRAHGSVVGKGVLHWYGLIAGNSDAAVALDGFGSELRLRGVPQLRHEFTMAAWVLPGPKVSNRTIIARPGAWYLRTDILGHWSGGFFHRRRIVGVSTPKLTARSPRPGLPRPALHKPALANRTSGAHSGSGGGTSPIVSEVILMVIAGFGVAAIPRWVRRRRRSRAEAPAAPVAPAAPDTKE
jgi:Concanavalin A-like lectin/glucanases superfamily